MEQYEWHECQPADCLPPGGFTENDFEELERMKEIVATFKRDGGSGHTIHFYQSEQDAELVGIFALLRGELLDSFIHINSRYGLQTSYQFKQQKFSLQKTLYLLTGAEELRPAPPRRGMCSCGENPGLSTKPLTREGFIGFCEAFVESYAYFLRHHKVGVLFQERPDEDEDAVLAKGREDESAEFQAFMDAFGAAVDMRTHTGYDGDTGRIACECLVAAGPGGHECLCHVAPWMPDGALERKRHVGNDAVVIVFRQTGQSADPLDASTLLLSRVVKTYVVVTPTDTPECWACRVITRTSQKTTTVPEYVSRASIEHFRLALAMLCLNVYRTDPDFRAKLERLHRVLILGVLKYD